MLKELTLMSLLKAGVHFGHQKTKWQPKTKPYVYTVRNNIHIIDLQSTLEKLNQAKDFIRDLLQNKKTLLFVDTKRQTKKLTQKTAEELNMPYATERWLGGTFTNFAVVHKLIQKLRDFEAKHKAGEFKKYTKKEQHEIKQEIDRLNRLIGGIKTLDKLPDAIFVVDANHDKLAVKEASETNVLVVALTDTNTDPTKINYPIPANDDAITSVKLILGEILNAGREK